MDDGGAAVNARWEKLGLLFGPDGSSPWMKTHAQLPLPVAAPESGPDRFHVYFASRDAGGRSHIGKVTVDLGDRPAVVSVDSDPLLRPGPTGTFDADGVYPASLVTVGGERRLYYIGWLRGAREPLFLSAIGLATAATGVREFTRTSAAPIVDRGPHDPCLVTSPAVYALDDGWRMVYVSGLGWEAHAGRLHSRYHLKAASSRDGITWLRSGEVAVDFKDATETNLGRPCIIRTESGWQMWFCAASLDTKYRLAYAESADGLRWSRCDERAGLEPSADPSAYDAEMAAYPYIVRHRNAEFMFYNGNGYGRDGFALARRPLDDD